MQDKTNNNYPPIRTVKSNLPASIHETGVVLTSDGRIVREKQTATTAVNSVDSNWPTRFKCKRFMHTIQSHANMTNL